MSAGWRWTSRVRCRCFRAVSAAAWQIPAADTSPAAGRCSQEIQSALGRHCQPRAVAVSRYSPAAAQSRRPKSYHPDCCNLLALVMSPHWILPRIHDMRWEPIHPKKFMGRSRDIVHSRGVHKGQSMKTTMILSVSMLVLVGCHNVRTGSTALTADDKGWPVCSRMDRFTRIRQQDSEGGRTHLR